MEFFDVFFQQVLVLTKELEIRQHHCNVDHSEVVFNRIILLLTLLFYNCFETVLQFDRLQDLIDEIRHTQPVIAPMGMFEIGSHLISMVNSLDLLIFGQ